MNAGDAPEPSGQIHPDRVGFGDRLIAELIRIRDESEAASDDAEATRTAVRLGGDFERRIVNRARSHPDAPELEKALHQLNGAALAVILFVLVLAALAGAATARAVLAARADEPVNFFWALGGALGVQTIVLLLWFVLMFVNPSALSAGSLGGLVMAFGRRVGHWMHKGPAHLAAARATGTVFTRGSIGRWTLSAISHGLWLSFLFACLGLVLLMLSARQYTFAWETTILSERTYVPLTRAIASGPKFLGFNVPDEAQIRASQWTGAGAPPVDARQAWSGLLVGSIFVYGVLPRIVLLIVCLMMRHRAIARYRLDVSLPGYVRLRPRLMPQTASIGVVDADGDAPPIAPFESASQQNEDSAGGPVALAGLEIERPPTWPPVSGVDWLDLGIVESREDRNQAIGRLRDEPHGRVLVACSLTATPDRGMQTVLERMRAASGRMMLLLLTDGDRLRHRESADLVTQRIEDWKHLAASVGIGDEHVIELDLEHLTRVSEAKLARLLGVERTDDAPVRRLEPAFGLIAEHAERWGGAPELTGQAELHRAIAKLYGNEPKTWMQRFKLPLDLKGDLKQQLRTGADRFVDRLPANLRLNPKWLAAGAMSGALGCIAAATLITPGAIAVLPIWTGLGTALAGAVQAFGRKSGRDLAADDDGAENAGLGEAVAAAALFAMLLELQGRDESAITRVLEGALVDDDLDLPDATAARAWLESMRHRFDLALAREGAS